jgi:hypothetical protein
MSRSEPKALIVPFRPRSMRERVSGAVVAILCATVLILVAVRFPSEPLRYFATAILLVIGSLFVSHLLNRVSESRFDFCRRILTQTYRGLFPYRVRAHDLRQFNTVTSSITWSRSGPTGITVSVRGLSKTVDVAWFGWEGLTQDGSKYDHPEAAELRNRLSRELGLRDLGVI